MKRLSIWDNRLFGQLKLTFLLTLAFVVAGFFLRSILLQALDKGLRDTVTNEWAALKGVLQIKNGMAEWNYDRDDPDEARVADRLKRVFLLADAHGSVLQMSDTYAELDQNDPARAHLASESSWRVREDTKGAAYLIRT